MRRQCSSTKVFSRVHNPSLYFYLAHTSASLSAGKNILRLGSGLILLCSGLILLCSGLIPSPWFVAHEPLLHNLRCNKSPIKINRTRVRRQCSTTKVYSRIHYFFALRFLFPATVSFSQPCVLARMLGIWE